MIHKHCCSILTGYYLYCAAQTERGCASQCNNWSSRLIDIKTRKRIENLKYRRTYSLQESILAVLHCSHIIDLTFELDINIARLFVSYCRGPICSVKRILSSQSLRYLGSHGGSYTALHAIFLRQKPCPVVVRTS